MSPSEPPPVPCRRAFGVLGQRFALVLASGCVAATAWCLYDIAYRAGSPNDWGDPAQTDLFLAWIINVPGWLAAFGLALLARPGRRALVFATFMLAAAEVVLLAFEPAALRMDRRRQEKRVDEMVRALENVDRAAKTPGGMMFQTVWARADARVQSKR